MTDETVFGPTHKMVELEQPRDNSGRFLPEAEKCETCGKPADVIRTHLRRSGRIIEVLVCGHRHVSYDD